MIVRRWFGSFLPLSVVTTRWRSCSTWWPSSSSDGGWLATLVALAAAVGVGLPLSPPA